MASREGTARARRHVLAGYAIECKLKALAMELHRCRTLAMLSKKWNIDDRHVYTHGLQALGQRLPLWANLNHGMVREDFHNQVNQWRPSWRYDPEDWLNGKALMFTQTVRRVYHWLDNNRLSRGSYDTFINDQQNCQKEDATPFPRNAKARPEVEVATSLQG